MSDSDDSIGELSQDKKKNKRLFAAIWQKKYKIENVCFILAHEVRHAIHIKRGLFQEYYESGDKAVGIIAERDCDAFADA